MKKLELISCKAPLWANSGHGQTLWAHFIKSPILADVGERHEVMLPDGDRLFCYVKKGSSPFVVTLFHGLSGDVRADYMQRTAALCEKLGHSVVLVNHRGVGEGAPFAVQPYHSGRAEDVSAVIRKMRELFPGKKQIAVGYSMSGNMLLCLLGGFRGDSLPDGAITVNAPINLRRGSWNLKRGLNRMYDLRFVLRLRELVESKYHQGLVSQRYEIPWWATVWDFDQLYTAPAAGFRSREDYYEQCSGLHYVDKIQVPTYVLAAVDDPFIDVQDYRQAPLSSSVQLHLESRGGHLGYLSRELLPEINSPRWLDYYQLQALRALEETLS